MKLRAAAALAAFLMLGACGKKDGATAEPASRTAAVTEKTPAAGTTAPPTIDKAVSKPAEPTPEPKPAEPVPEPKPAEPTPEPKPAEPVPEPKPAEPTPEPKPTEPTPEPTPEGASAIAPDLIVTDAAVTDSIVDRMPNERKTTWKIGEDARLVGWFEFKNPESAVDLELVWKKDGKENWRFPTNVGKGKNWRTWAEKRIGKKDAGRWTVEVVDANGHVYKSIAYSVE